MGSLFIVTNIKMEKNGKDYMHNPNQSRFQKNCVKKF